MTFKVGDTVRILGDITVGRRLLASAGDVGVVVHADRPNAQTGRPIVFEYDVRVFGGDEHPIPVDRHEIALLG